MSTLAFDVPSLTVAVDPGPSRTAVGARRGRVMLNCGVFAPPEDLWNLTQHDILRAVVDRAASVAGLLEATYALPGERVRRVVEVPSRVARGKSAIPTMLTRELAQLLVHMHGFEPFYTRPRLVLGERHRLTRGGPYPVESCYPDGYHDRWGESGAPDVHGRPVARLPNEDAGKRRTEHRVLRRKCRDAQTVFDLAAVVWMDDHELSQLAPRRARER